MEENEVIIGFDKLIKQELEKLAYAVDVKSLERLERLIILRSGPLSAFARLLQQMNSASVTPELLVIGKPSDAQTLDDLVPGRWQLLGVEGSYTSDKLAVHAQTFRDFAADGVLFLSRTMPDTNYMNIYEVIEQTFYAHTVFCSDFDGELSQINDMQMYMATLRLHLAMGQWYWERSKRGEE